MTVRHAVLLVGLTMLATAGAIAAPNATGPRKAERRNVLLVTVESLRADRLGCYTGGRRSTPAIDDLAVRGIRFERAYTASPSTAPSIATILTGLYPARHGIRDDLESRLLDGVVTLAEILTKAGYRTGAVVGSSHLDSRRGLNRGFETYDDEIRPTTSKMLIAIAKERPAEEVVAKGLVSLDAGKKDKPFFLWLDLFDAHYEYAPPGPLAKEYAGDPYQGEVTYVDKQISVLMAALRERKLDQTTHILLVGSHGEGLGDHGETGHGIYLYEATIRVPLIAVPAGIRPVKAVTARVVDRPVGLVDLTPTVLGLLGIHPPDGLDGVSLASNITRANPKPLRSGKLNSRRIFVEAVQPWAAYGWSPLFAVIRGNRKVVRGQRTEAFDLQDDPTEGRPITQTPGWTAGLEAFGRPLLGSLGFSEDERPNIIQAAAALELPWRNEPYCLEKQNWPDPRDRVDLNDKLFRARSAFYKGWVGQAAILSHEVRETDPANFTALDYVTFLGVRNGLEEMLMESLSILQCNFPFRGTPYHYWGHYLERRTDRGQAEKALLLFSRLEPRNEEPFYDLAAFYAASGNKGLAFENLQRAIRLGADDLETIRQDPRLHPLKDDPRLAELLGPATSSPTSEGDPSNR